MGPFDRGLNVNPQLAALIGVLALTARILLLLAGLLAAALLLLAGLLTRILVLLARVLVRIGHSGSPCLTVTADNGPRPPWLRECHGSDAIIPRQPSDGIMTAEPAAEKLPLYKPFKPQLVLLPAPVPTC